MTNQKERKNSKCECGGEYHFNSYCGAFVCDECGNHKGLNNCYCGWRAGGWKEMPTGDEPINYKAYSEYLSDYIYDLLYTKFQDGTEEEPMTPELFWERHLEDLGQAIYECNHDL